MCIRDRVYIGSTFCHVVSTCSCLCRWSGSIPSGRGRRWLPPPPGCLGVEPCLVYIVQSLLGSSSGKAKTRREQSGENAKSKIAIVSGLTNYAASVDFLEPLSRVSFFFSWQLGVLVHFVCAQMLQHSLILNTVLARWAVGSQESGILVVM